MGLAQGKLVVCLEVRDSDSYFAHSFYCYWLLPRVATILLRSRSQPWQSHGPSLAKSRTDCHLLDLPMWGLRRYKWLLIINQCIGLVSPLKMCTKVSTVPNACRLHPLTIIAERFDKAGADPMHGILSSSWPPTDILIDSRGDTRLPNQSTAGELQYDQRHDIQGPTS